MYKVSYKTKIRNKFNFVKTKQMSNAACLACVEAQTYPPAHYLPAILKSFTRYFKRKHTPSQILRINLANNMHTFTKCRIFMFSYLNNATADINFAF